MVPVNTPTGPAGDPPQNSILMLIGPQSGPTQKTLSIMKTLTAQHDHLHIVQSNHEGVLVEAIHDQGAISSCIIINAGSYAFTSIALADALVAISNINPACLLIEAYHDHPFDQRACRGQKTTSMLTPYVAAKISGFGIASYQTAIMLAQK